MPNFLFLYQFHWHKIGPHSALCGSNGNVGPKWVLCGHDAGAIPFKRSVFSVGYNYVGLYSICQLLLTFRREDNRESTARGGPLGRIRRLRWKSRSTAASSPAVAKEVFFLQVKKRRLCARSRRRRWRVRRRQSLRHPAAPVSCSNSNITDGILQRRSAEASLHTDLPCTHVQSTAERTVSISNDASATAKLHPASSVAAAAAATAQRSVHHE